MNFTYYLSVIIDLVLSFTRFLLSNLSQIRLPRDILQAPETKTRFNELPIKEISHLGKVISSRTS